jgi:hypothetical protein
VIEGFFYRVFKKPSVLTQTALRVVLWSVFENSNLPETTGGGQRRTMEKTRSSSFYSVQLILANPELFYNG